jgi:1-phosphofructokinase/tagatose 6-phosphate kinase
VARALKALGRPVLATGAAGGGTGARVIQLLEDEGITNDFVRINEESRMSTAVIDPTDGVTTEINERGPALSNAERDRAVERVLYLAQGAQIVVLCGSLPRGVPVELYGELIEALRSLNVTTILDTEGEPLRVGTRACPDLVTPNLVEAEELVGHEFADDEDRMNGVRAIVEMGAKNAVITSESGCVAVLGGDSAERVAYRVSVDAREPVSAVGAGDAFLAGYVAALYERKPDEEALRFAVACGAESVRHVGAGVIDPREVERLLPEVTVDRLGEPAFLSP